jgi:hypothetical protein
MSVKMIVFMVLALALAACSGAAATPASLESVLVQEGDLPAGLTAGPASTELPDYFDQMPESDASAFVPLQSGQEQAGWVVAFRYGSDEEVFDGAVRLVRHMPAEKRQVLVNFGDEAYSMIVTDPAEGGPYTDILFTQCRFVVHVRMQGVTELSQVTSYTKKLDQRLNETYCTNI